MRFSWNRAWQPLLLGILIAGLSGGLGCDANLPGEDEVFEDAVQRVNEVLLPPLVDESAVVYRNVLNLFAMLPEICSTPLATMGSFVSSLPTLGPPNDPDRPIKFDDDDGDWALQWQNVVFGPYHQTATFDPQLPRVNLTLIVRFRDQALQVLQAVPFTVVPQGTTQLPPIAGEPPSYAAASTEGFFLYQDEVTGEWTLRWRALGTSKVFEGRILSDTGLSRVIRRVGGSAQANAAADVQREVTSLTVIDSALDLRFEESTAPTDEKGISFFVRPGDRVRLRLRTGPSSGNLSVVTGEQVVLGRDELHPTIDASNGEFSLASSLPTNPVATVSQLRLPSGVERGTLIAQDIEQNGCNLATEDQWRLRFINSQATTTTFEGAVRARDDDNAILRVTPVGACPTGRLSSGNRVLEYDCRLTGVTTPEHGYDICLLRGNRLTFTPEVDGLRDPGLVFIGAAADPPSSPDPFSIRIDVELQELQSAQNLKIEDTLLLIRGNNDDEEAALPINRNQVSREPLCHVPGELVQPRVRLNGDGEYSTARFLGNAFELDDVEFLQSPAALDNGERFPENGILRLLTRVADEINNSEIVVSMGNIVTVTDPTTQEPVTRVPIQGFVNVQEVEVNFAPTTSDVLNDPLFITIAQD